MIDEIKALLVATLNIELNRARDWTKDTALLGQLPELDSVAIVGVLTGLEAKFGIHIADDEISADAFESIGSLCRFVEGQLVVQKPSTPDKPIA